MTSLQARASLAGVLVTFVLGSCAATPGDASVELPDPRDKILFVYFFVEDGPFWKNGLWRHMEDLTETRREDMGAETSQGAGAGSSLWQLWERSKVEEEIAEGGYDVVVLQHDLPEAKVADFHECAAVFDAHTREAGSRLIFSMVWDYERLNWSSMDGIIAEYKRIPWALDAEVAPCGYAWQRAMAERPEVGFYSQDSEHKGWYGTILNLYVTYSTVYGESPAALEFAPPKKSEITAEEDAWLRRVAWDSYQSWQDEVKEGPE